VCVPPVFGPGALNLSTFPLIRILSHGLDNLTDLWHRLANGFGTAAILGHLDNTVSSGSRSLPAAV
jgi:hypothetical protein